MTDFRIRPFEDRDYPAIVAVGNAVYTERPWSVEEARHEDARYDGDKYVLRRFVVERFLFRSQQFPDVLYQGLTGTRRAYRGRGIALALKLRIVGYARERGYRQIRTWNDTLNAPMLHINLKLGFVRQPAWITFEKILG